jgi:hypothetical protein
MLVSPCVTMQSLCSEFFCIWVITIFISSTLRVAGDITVENVVA